MAMSVDFQGLRILPGTDDIGTHFPRTMIQRMPQPPCTLFGADETPHFIELGCATSLDADSTNARTRRWYQREVGVLKRESFF